MVARMGASKARKRPAGINPSLQFGLVANLLRLDRLLSPVFRINRKWLWRRLKLRDHIDDSATLPLDISTWRHARDQGGRVLCMRPGRHNLPPCESPKRRSTVNLSGAKSRAPIRRYEAACPPIAGVLGCPPSFFVQIRTYVDISGQRLRPASRPKRA